MSTSIDEAYGSREISVNLYDGDTDGDSHERRYVIKGTADEETALAATIEECPTEIAGLVRIEADLEPVHIDENNEANCIWTATVSYGPEPSETGDWSLDIDTTGGTQHLSQSLETVASYPSTAPDYKGAIGVSKDSVEGVDIVVSQFAWTETHYIPDSTMTRAYIMLIAGCTGKTNSTAFKGYQPGEVLFLGATASVRSGNNDWEVTFKFAASFNKTDITVGDITGIDKKGWEYMWVRYESIKDAVAKVLVQRPAAVYIERVYEQDDFNNMNLG